MAAQEQQQRLARIVRGVRRVIAMREAVPVVPSKLSSVLEIYAAAIASSSFLIGCDELTQLAESKVAAFLANEWELAPPRVRR